jgi:hypothetical protein
LSFTLTNMYSISNSLWKWYVLLFFGTLIFHYIQATVLSPTTPHKHTDAFKINKITRAEQILSFRLHWHYPQTLYVFNAQQSDKSPPTANNTSHLSVQRTEIHSWLQRGNRVNHMFCRSLLQQNNTQLTMSDEIWVYVMRIAYLTEV